MFLRNGKTKNNPRELYIIEDKEDRFFLIRKLNKKLRQRLYKALPDELLIAPSALDPKRESQQEVTNDQKPLLTKSGRPLRKAAMKAHGISKISTNTPNTTALWKFGWRDEDQPSDEETIFITPTVTPNHSEVSSTNSTSDDSDTSFTISEIEELTWDSSPEQFSLSTPEPIYSQIIESNNPTYKPSWRFAISQQPLSRSNAFKNPPDANVPIPNSSSQQNTPIQRRSRVPRPTTPTNVDLHQVIDLSSLPPPFPTSPTCPPAPRRPLPPRRNTKQPANYLHFHNTGNK